MFKLGSVCVVVVLICCECQVYAAEVYQAQHAKSKGGATEVQVASSAAGDPMVEAVLLRALGTPKKKIEEVDLAACMNTAGLAQFFEPDQWPDSGAVRELASQLKPPHQKKFVAVDLHK